MLLTNSKIIKVNIASLSSFIRDLFLEVIRLSMNATKQLHDLINYYFKRLTKSLEHSVTFNPFMKELSS